MTDGLFNNYQIIFYGERVLPLKLVIPKFFKRALGLCAFYIFCIVGPAESTCPDNMAAYWKLNEIGGTIYTASVGNENGQCTDVCPRAEIREGINGAQIFDGSTTGINIPSSPVFDWAQADSFSVEFWAKRGAGGLSEDEVCIGRYDDASGLEWWIGISATGVAKFVLTSINNESFVINGTTNIADDAWHHIIAIRNAPDNEITLLVDGQQENSGVATYSAGFESDAADLNIGWLNDADTGHHFDGVIDEIALYDGVISDELIVPHFLNGLADFRWGYCDTPQQIRIMPLGDSITAGVAVVNGQELEDGLMVGYRQTLWFYLVSLGYDVDFVGSQTYGQLAEPAFDTDNEGHPGWSDSQIAENIFNWLTLNPPHIVLLHIGTNGLDPSPRDIENILDNIDSYDKNITVVLARIINRKEYSADTTSFNNNIEAMAKERIANGDKIIIVDMENALIYPDDMSDGLHPNSNGYEKMVRVWLGNLIRLTSFSDIAPSITSVPETKTTVASPYTYEIEAIGTPPLTYILAAGAPDDMVIDGDTGRIRWTPFDEGRFDITARVVNSAGKAEQSFTIEVGPRENQAPTANAGPDQSVTEGAVVTLDGSASSDPDGGIVSYKWEQVAGESVSLADPSVPRTQFTAPSVGTFGLTFRLTVTDKGGEKGVDTISIIVNAATPPNADPGPDQVAENFDAVILDGSNSSAAGGSIVSYLWEQVAGKSVTLSAPTSPVTQFEAPAVGESGDSLIFRLTVRDSNGHEASEEVSVKVTFVNKPPVARAGQDQIVSEGSTVTLDGSQSYDPDGGILSYRWTQVGGTPVGLASSDAVRTTFVAPQVGVAGLTFRLTVTDKENIERADEVLITVNDNGITLFPDGVIRFASATGLALGIRVESGGKLVKLNPVAANTVSDTVNRPENIIYGLLDAEIRADTPGGTAIVTVFLPEPAAGGAEWHEYKEADGWRGYGNDAVFNETRDRITLTLTDGGTRDNSTLSVPDGFIRSLSGLGRMPTPKKEEKDDLISCFIRSANIREPEIFDRISVILLISIGSFLRCGFRKLTQNKGGRM